MAKRIKVGPRYRRGFKLKVGGEWKWFAPGSILPEEFNATIPNRFFRDKRAIWVDVEEPAKKKKAPPKPQPKPSPKLEEKAENSASPSPTSEGAGALAPAPLEVKAEEEEKVAEKPVTKKKTRRRKKLFGE